jgi:hypothetical protein
MTLPMVKFLWAMDTTIILAIFQRLFSCSGEGHVLDGSAVYKITCLSEEFLKCLLIFEALVSEVFKHYHNWTGNGPAL